MGLGAKALDEASAKRVGMDLKPIAPAPKTEGMNFGEALQAMKAGKMVRRDSGNIYRKIRLNGMCLEKMGTQSWVSDTLEHGDLVAIDWRILPEENPEGEHMTDTSDLRRRGAGRAAR
jgi:hypothetical protein